MTPLQSVEIGQAQAPQQFTPEEAIQILTDAVNLSSQYLSLAQLEAIADEAGISRETLYESIQKHARQVDDAKLRLIRKQERRQRWKARIKKGLLLMGVCVLVYASFLAGIRLGQQSVSRSSYSHSPQEPTVLNITFEELPLFGELYAVQSLHSKQGAFYVMPYAYSYADSNRYTSVWYKSEDGLSRVIFKTRGQIVRASVSEDGKLLALYVRGSNDGGVWVVDVASGERHRIITEQGGGGIVLYVDGDQATAYGSEIAWVEKRKLRFSTTHGLYTCEVSERGAPLRYEKFKGN